MAKNKKAAFKNADNMGKILGVRINSTNINKVLKKIYQRVIEGRKTLIFTPNPEFLVFASEKQNLWFKRLLNLADISLPDGIGLVWAAKILGEPVRERVAGADVVEGLLRLANKYKWRVGVVGARRGNISERRKQIKILSQKYPEAEIAALEDTLNWEKQKWHLVFACQGMGTQEKWAAENLHKLKILAIMGAGGSLDFLTGFAPRAPFFIRKIGFEWFFRLLVQPWRWQRQIALVKFILLVFRQKLLDSFSTKI